MKQGIVIVIGSYHNLMLQNKGVYGDRWNINIIQFTYNGVTYKPNISKHITAINTKKVNDIMKEECLEFTEK